MKTLMFVLVAAAALMLFASQATPAEGTASKGTTGYNGPTTEQLVAAREKVQWNRSRTVYWRHRARLPQIHSSHAERHTRSLAYIHWINHKWVKHRIRAKWLAFHIPMTNDWATAVRLVQRTWPGTSQWMLGTSIGEGGHGICVWNGGYPCNQPCPGQPYSSCAAGWLQYMSGTFYSHLGSALAYARSRHLPVIPRAARTWFSPLGQAFAGGWGCHYNASAWSWHGGC